MKVACWAPSPFAVAGADRRTAAGEPDLPEHGWIVSWSTDTAYFAAPFANARLADDRVVALFAKGVRDINSWPVSE